MVLQLPAEFRWIILAYGKPCYFGSQLFTFIGPGSCWLPGQLHLLAQMKEITRVGSWCPALQFAEILLFAGISPAPQPWRAKHSLACSPCAFGRAQSAQGLLCAVSHTGFCFKTWQSISGLALCERRQLVPTPRQQCREQQLHQSRWGKNVLTTAL